MKKIYLVLGVIVALVVVFALTIDFNFSRTVDWEESFNEKSNKPYGLSVFYKELKTIYEDKKIRTLYHQPNSYFSANSEGGYGDHIAEGTYMKIGNSTTTTFESIEELLYFASLGNTLFISDYYLPSQLVDTLRLDIDYVENEKDSISYLSFKDENFEIKNTEIDKNEGDFYFASFDSINQTVLGYTNNKDRRINFIKAPFEKGTIYIHLQPKIFTNYNILKDDRYKYVEGILSYLPNENIYFDSYSKYQTSYDGDVEQSSELGWFLEQRAFKWAWYLALLLTLLFIVFNAKRRQRIVQIIKPLKNTTLAFVNTISNVYFETQDHKNLIEKKSAYFLEKVRMDFNMDTSNLNKEFIDRLTLKSGVKKKKVEAVINYIVWLKDKRQYFESNLIHLNKLVEDFYSK